MQARGFHWVALLGLAVVGCGADADRGEEFADCEGVTCDGDQFCAFRACGLSEGEAAEECVPRPTDCPAEGPSVCGRDGVVYDNECEANRVGVPSGSTEACDTPEGLFGCAGSFCDLATELCVQPWSDCDGGESATCVPFPASCDGVEAPGCDCIDSSVCGTGEPECSVSEGATRASCQL